MVVNSSLPGDGAVFGRIGAELARIAVLGRVRKEPCC